ncbi:MAG: hypothetical protein QM579_00585, partial [Desulfovibrio sp.]
MPVSKPSFRQEKRLYQPCGKAPQAAPGLAITALTGIQKFFVNATGVAMRPCHILVHAALIVTQDEDRNILENASLAVLDGLVAAMGPRSEMTAQWQPEQEVDLGQSVLMPGLVN